MYADNVEECKAEVVTHLLGMWMNNAFTKEMIADLDCHDLEDEELPSTNPLLQTMGAVHDSYTRVGLRDRNPASSEAIGRQIRNHLEGSGMVRSDISFWSELGIQMYFNPPYHVRAAAGRIEGFR
jgi:hypothetical protein